MRDVLSESFDIVSEVFKMVPDELFFILITTFAIYSLVVILRFVFDGFYSFDFPSDDNESDCSVGDISKCPYGCKSYNSEFCEKFCMFLEDDYASN